MDETEMLARMWIDCDPNRDPETGDDLHEFADSRVGKRWEWFVPRAEASQKFFAEHGYKLVKVLP